MNDQTHFDSSDIAFLKNRVAELEALTAQQRADYKDLQQLYEQATVCYQSLDENGFFLDVNQFWLDTLGFTREEVIGKNFSEFLHPETQGQFIPKFTRFKAIGEVLGAEFQMVKKNGATLLVSLVGRINRDLSGQFKQTHCIFQDNTDRRQTELALKTESIRRRVMFEQSPDGILIIDPETKGFLEFNTAAHQQLGYSRKEFAQLTIADVEARETVEETAARVASVLRDGKADFETLHRTRQEEIRNVHVTAQTIEIHGETVYHCTWRDITERKQTEVALVREQQIGKMLLNSLPGIYYLYTYPELRLVRWNKNHETLLGFEPGDINNRSIFDWHPPEAWDSVLKAVEVTMERGISTIEAQLLDKNGGLLPFLLTGTKVEFSGQTYLMGVGIDITERKQAERAVLESEEKYRLVFESANDAIFVCDMQARILKVNPLACRRLGYMQAELLSMTVDQIDADEDAKQVPGRMKRLMEQGHLTFETRHKCKNGTLISVEVSAWQVTWDGQLVIMSICRDITDRKLAEKEKKQLQTQLMQAQKMEAIGTLAGGIAHDFNNILGGILGYAELARNASPAESPAVKWLDKELAAIHRASELVKQILDFSRKAEPKRIPLQLADVIKETIKFLGSTLPSTITIKLQVDTAQTILADQTQVNQILINLCTNAFHAMETTGGILDISLKDCELSLHDLRHQPKIQPGRFVELSIRDTGAGIPLRAQERIFEPYFTTKETGRGTGMGLAIVHGIVKNYGGFITFESRPGAGTVFHLFFPAIEQVAADEVETEVSIPSGNERILLIDDEEFLAEIGKAMLEELGYTVTVKTSSLEALVAFQDQPDGFDVVITDQTMPDMTGTELAHEIFQVRQDLPIILCTGYSTIITEESAKNCGIREVATKPLSIKGIAVLLRTVLDGH